MAERDSLLFVARGSASVSVWSVLHHLLDVNTLGEIWMEQARVGLMAFIGG